MKDSKKKIIFIVGRLVVVAILFCCMYLLLTAYGDVIVGPQTALSQMSNTGSVLPLKTYLFIKKIVAINLMVFYAIFLIRCINQILNTLKENNIEN